MRRARAGTRRWAPGRADVVEGPDHDHRLAEARHAWSATCSAADCCRDATLTLETEGLVRPVDLPVLRGDPGRLERATGGSRPSALDDTDCDVLAYWLRELAR